MRDLKKTHQKTKKVRQNRVKQKKQPLQWRKFLPRVLRVSIALFSVTLIFVGGFFVTQFLMASDLFRVDEVTVQGNRRLRSEQVAVLSDIEKGVNTFELDLDLIGRKIEENPWIQTAQVQRIFPRQVVIRVTERKPVAIINLGYLYYLDQRGEIFKVLGAADSLDYPVVTGFDYEKAQQHDSEYAHDLRQIVELLDDIRQRPQFDLKQVSEVHRDKTGDLTLFTLRGGVRVKLGRGDYKKKIDRLEKIYARLKPKLKILDYIDLNVDEKVIVRIERLKKTAKG
jgi:cell division protein FtsQ